MNDCNCEGKKYSISMGCCQPVLAPIENYYTKYEIDKIIEDIEISGGCCITEAEVDAKISAATEDLASKSDIPTVPTKVSAFQNDVPYLTQHQPLDDYVTDGEMSAYTYDKETIDRKIASGGTFDPTNYYDKYDIDNIVESAVTKVEGEMPTVPTNVSAFVNDVPYLTHHQSLDGYATEAEMSAYTYDKATIDNKIASGGTFDPTNYYNKTEVNNIVNSAKTAVEAEIPTVPTNVSAFNNDAGYLTQHQSLSNYYTKNETSGATEIANALNQKVDSYVLGNYALKTEIPTNVSAFNNDAHYITSAYTYDKATIDSKIASGGTFDPTNYFNKTETINLVESARTEVEAEMPTVPTNVSAFQNDAGYLTQHQSLDNYYTKSQTDSLVELSTNDMATKTWVGEQGYATTDWVKDQHYISGVDLSDYATTQWVEDQHYISGVDLSNYALKSEIPTVPTNVSAFNNDAGYLTQHQSLSAYSTTDEVNSAITEATSGLQETLVAGENITIEGNVISATGGGGGGETYYAGDGINISNENVISTVTKFWCGSMADWSLVSGNTDSNTIYMVHD